MEPSEEIRRVIRRWMTAISEGDIESALARLSDHPGALIIGTDAKEWWRGTEAHAVWRRQLEEMGAFSIAGNEIEAWEEGTLGWAAVQETLTWAGKSFDSRATYVLHLERGEWKIVHTGRSLRRTKSSGWS